MAGAPKGNRNAKKGKEWFDALRKQTVQRDTLRKMAEAVCIAAEAGEPWAIAEVGNRFDGKPAQSVELSGEVAVLSHEEWLEQLDHEG